MKDRILTLKALLLKDLMNEIANKEAATVYNKEESRAAKQGGKKNSLFV
jgi:hypothetical protein